MEITKIDVYLDGGTIKIIATDEIYCIDSRIKTKTKGSIFFGYPKHDNSNIVPNQDNIKTEMKTALEKYTELEFGTFDWKPQMYKLLSDL